MISRAVVDASVIASWFLSDETPQHDSVLEHMDKIRIHVPMLFQYEMVSILLNAQRRKRIDGVTALNILETVNQYPLSLEAPFPETVLELAQVHHLTAYDASYLELAIRLNAPLISYDTSLLKTAKALKLKTAVS